MRVSTVIAGFLAFVPATFALPTDSDANPEKFLETCWPQYLVGEDKYTLYAECWIDKDDDSPRITTELDLNLCIGYSSADHQLHWQAYGKFFNTCSGISLSKEKYDGTNGGELTLFLLADCRDLTDPDKTHSVELNLNKGISNENGYLTCRGGRGVLVTNSSTTTSSTYPTPTGHAHIARSI